jgi:host factor-I protein
MITTTFSQDESLEFFIKARTAVSVFLVNGIQLKGIIGGFDESSILLQNVTNLLIFKHAISTILPGNNEIKEK